jgi:hypothetical protein
MARGREYAQIALTLNCHTAISDALSHVFIENSLNPSQHFKLVNAMQLISRQAVLVTNHAQNIHGG